MGRYTQSIFVLSPSVRRCVLVWAEEMRSALWFCFRPIPRDPYIMTGACFLISLYISGAPRASKDWDGNKKWGYCYKGILKKFLSSFGCLLFYLRGF